MKILDTLGLGRKKPEGAPNIGEKKKKDELKAEERRKIVYRVLIIIGFLGIVLYSLPEVIYQPIANYSVGEPWRADDLTAPYTFSLMKSEAELEEEREEIRRQTPPIFHIDHSVRNTTQTALDSTYRNLQPVIDTFVQWQRAKMNNEATARNDSIRFEQEKNFLSIDLSNESWSVLLNNYAGLRIDNQAEGQPILENFRSVLDRLITQLYNTGIINIQKEEIEGDEITIRNLRDRTERTLPTNRVRDYYEAMEYAQQQLQAQFNTDVARIALKILDRALQPNWMYSEEDTQTALEENLESISRTKGVVTNGEVIVRHGDIVTPERAAKLRSLAQARSTTATEFERTIRRVGESLVVMLVTILFLYYLYLYRKKIFNDVSSFLMVFLILTLLCVASATIYHFEDLSSLVIPIAIAPIILTIIFDSRVGLMATLTLAIITALIHDNNFEYLVATITACSLGIFSVRDIKNRSQFFLSTPFIVFVSYMLVFGGFALARYAGWNQFLDTTVSVAINSVFILFTYPLILIIEKTFKVTTDFTLLELSDTNRPLMKDLMNKAPGTFHHSLQVANLAEAAASSIEANALLCRVGAMYHDIGKMVKPSYFIENQSKGNDHDKLKAKMSALIIKAHVSDGVKMARKNNIPELIVDFIRTHHGTSLIRFFYGKAQKNAEKETEIPEEDFRYDGPRPFTKEQGILLLADSVEAASRAMKNPTYNKLETLIDRITEDHISEGQLNNCPLTFRHIQIIKETFLSILVGVYHSRVEYPDDDELKSKKMARKKDQKKSNVGTDQPGDRRPDSDDNGDAKVDDDAKPDGTDKPDKPNEDQNQQESEDQKKSDS